MELSLLKKETIGDVDKQLSCYHCGDPCDKEDIFIEDKPFCCQGCKMVYEILNQNDLVSYYTIEDQPGTTQKNQKETNYEFLDDPDVKASLISFSDGSVLKVTFFFPQIHCSSCIWLLEHLYKLNEGVQSAQVNFLKKEGTFMIDEKEFSLRQLVELLSSIGYAPDLKLADQEKERAAVDRSLYYKLGVAGFAFGNIMLLSFPEYLGVEDTNFQIWFGYFNVLLALPVLLYCARDYLLSAWWGIRQGRVNMDVPIALGILTLFGRSVFEIFSHTGAGYLDSFAGLVFFLLIGKWFQQATYHTLHFERNYKSYFPISVTVKRDNDWRSIPLNKVEVEDILLIRNQELIPADGILTKGKGQIDYSFVTGESDPVSKNPGDIVYAGGKQVGQSIEITVNKKVEQSYLTQLWNESAFHEQTENKSLRFADQTGKYFTIVILGIAFTTLIYWSIFDPSLAINAFTAVLIIACPCAIALSIPFTYGNVLRILARYQFFIKHINVIEAIQNLNHIVFDKTGTLTSSVDQEVQFIGADLSAEEKTWIKSLANESAHPLSRKIVQSIEDTKVRAVTDFAELPGQGIQGRVGETALKIGAAKYVGTASKVNGTTAHLSINGKERGYFQFNNPMRAGLVENFERLAQDYQLSLLSGDNDREKKRFSNLFTAEETMHFEQSPLQKLQYIQKMQNEGQTVMMIGDGLNDAGALKQSDVGVVITENINNFTPASDAILAAEQFPNLSAMLVYVRISKRVIWATYLLAFVYNVVGLSFAIPGTLSPVVAAILMPLSSVTVVIVGVGLSSWMAQILLPRKKKKGK